MMPQYTYIVNTQIHLTGVALADIDNWVSTTRICVTVITTSLTPYTSTETC